MRFHSADPELWHQLAHGEPVIPGDVGVEDPGLFVHICASELSLIMLGLTLVDQQYPCLRRRLGAFGGRMNELIDNQIHSSEGES